MKRLRHPSQNCVLGMLGNPNLNGIGLGLQLDGVCDLNPDFFACCDGKGLRYDECLQGFVPCNLKARFAGVKRLLGQYQLRWPQKKLPRINRQDSGSLLRDMAAMINGESPQAKILEGTSGKPGRIWLMALTLTWRFGLDVEVLSFDGYDQVPRIDWKRLDGQKAPPILLVEQWRKITNPLERDHFEVLINYVYNANTFLLLELTTISQPTKPSSKSNTTLHHTPSQRIQKFQAYIDQIKSRPPLELLSDFLEPDSYSQLASLCQLPRMASDSLQTTKVID